MQPRTTALALLALLIGCVTVHSPHEPRPASTTTATTRPHYRDLNIHAQTSLFSGTKLPPIIVNWLGDPLLRPAPYTLHTTYYDAAYHPVTAATQPGRYGAVVELTTSDGRLFRHKLTLFRFPESFDWDYVRLPMSIDFPRQFGINNAVVAEQHEDFSEFNKFRMWLEAEQSSLPAILLAGLYEAKPATGLFVARNGFRALDRQWWDGLNRKLNLPTLPYLIHLPPDYQKRPHDKFPLILFLHGSGECGYGDEELPKVRHGNLASIADSPQGLPGGFPFIVVSPQCPVHAGWSPYDLERLMQQIDSQYRVDPDREYLTGLSLGGYGTWDTAIAFPHRFAAIAPMSGAGDPNDVARIKDLPCWIFHGAKDPVIPLQEAQRMYDALAKIGGRAKLTIEPNAGHNSWNQPYHDPAFFAWLMQQQRSAPTQPPATRPTTHP
ncbi:MAG TPA: alpha/beta hydrolase-fold protein [Tepidisphaeraceae bacterium]|nr:alpha/beta hydrolase-fold protein [Tepidisphaeraceae bacterium]